MRSAPRLAILALSATLCACSHTPASGAAAPGSPPPVGSPPTPQPTDWKGLFDSDSLSSNVPPSPELAAEALRSEPSCTRVDTLATGSFTGTNRDERAFLLSCGATRRVVIFDEKARVAALDVSEDVIEDAGDLDLDGPHELLLHGHAGPKTTVRVLRFSGGQLSSFYSYAVTPDPCAHTIIYYRLVKPNMEYRVDTQPKRCTP